MASFYPKILSTQSPVRLFGLFRNNPRSVLSLSSSTASQPQPVPERLIILDTTLRDGEQSAGAALNLREKLKIASTLCRLGVDVCEAGFPASSSSEFDAVAAIAKEIGPITAKRISGASMCIAGFSRAVEKDIQRAFDAVKYAPAHRINVVLATSDLHLKHKLGMTRDECIRRAIEAVSMAASLCSDVEFMAEDATRSDPDFLVDVLSEVVKVGASTLAIPDTVGWSTPKEYGKLMTYLIRNIRTGIETSGKVIFSTHCHNDLGLATANTLAGISAGARQAEVTMNGIGERAGNAALEELVMILKIHQPQFPLYSYMDSTIISRCSQLVSKHTGIPIQPNKAIVGANAFAHASGIHQDGIMKNPRTYEIMSPADVGLQGNRMVLGKLSGKHAYRVHLESLGYEDLTPKELDYYVEQFKAVAATKKSLSDADIRQIMSDHKKVIQREQ